MLLADSVLPSWPGRPDLLLGFTGSRQCLPLPPSGSWLLRSHPSQDRCRSQTQGRHVLGLAFCSAATPLGLGVLPHLETEIVNSPHITITMKPVEDLAPTAFNPVSTLAFQGRSHSRPCFFSNRHRSPERLDHLPKTTQLGRCRGLRVPCFEPVPHARLAQRRVIRMCSVEEEFILTLVKNDKFLQ